MKYFKAQIMQSLFLRSRGVSSFCTLHTCLAFFQRAPGNVMGPPPFFHLNTNSVLVHVLVYSIDKTYVLVVTVAFSGSKSHRFRKFRRRYVKPPLAARNSHCQCFFCSMSAVQSGHVPFFQVVCPQ